MEPVIQEACFLFYLDVQQPYLPLSDHLQENRLILVGADSTFRKDRRCFPPCIDSQGVHVELSLLSTETAKHLPQKSRIPNIFMHHQAPATLLFILNSLTSSPVSPSL